MSFQVAVQVQIGQAKPPNYDHAKFWTATHKLRESGSIVDSGDGALSPSLSRPSNPSS